MVDVDALVADLRDESAEIDALVSELPAEGWATPTPAAGWTVAHQVVHLAWTDQRALLAVKDPAAFQAELAEAVKGSRERLERLVDAAADEGAAGEHTTLLADWRQGRDDLADALGQVPDGTKLPWYGPPMSAASMATARLMETWAHGYDIADALGVRREPTARRSARDHARGDRLLGLRGGDRLRPGRLSVRPPRPPHRPAGVRRPAPVSRTAR